MTTLYKYDFNIISHNTYFGMSFFNIISDVLAGVLALKVEDRGFEPWSGQTNDCKIGIFCFSAKTQC